MRFVRLCLALLVLHVAPATARAASAQVEASDPVSEFALAIYEHGVPYQEAHALGPEALPKLATLLGDESHKEYWRTIVATINYIGEPSSFPMLRDFILKRFHGEIDRPTYRAMGAMIATMGPMAAQSDEAFAFLVNGTDPKTWSSIHWTNEFHKGQYLKVLLSELAINSLSLSGRKEAAAVLERLSKAPFDDEQRDNITQGLKTMHDVERVGVEQYFATYGKGHVTK